MGRRDDDLGGAMVEQCFRGLGDGAGGVDHVVDEDAGAAGNLTDDAVGDDGVGDVDVARLVNEGQRRAAEPVGPAFGNANAAGVGRDNGDLAGVVVGGDVLGQQW